jgi:nitrile hydratase subunit alpha
VHDMGGQTGFGPVPAEDDGQVWDANSESRYLVLPLRPEVADGMDDTTMASLVTRNGLIGTAVR